MAVGSITEYFDDVYNHSWVDMASGYINEWQDMTPFYHEVAEKNKVKMRGGRRFEQPIKYGGNTTKKWLAGKTDTVDTQMDEKSTVAYYTAGTLAINITRYTQDEEDAYGNADAERRLVEDTLGDAKGSMIDELEEHAIGDGSDEADSPDSVLTYITESTPTLTAGIAPATFTWWDNYRIDMAGSPPAGNLYENMRYGYMQVSKKAPGIKGARRTPDMAFGGLTAQLCYENEVDDRTQHTSGIDVKNRLGDLGFARVHFKNLWVWWCPAMDDDKLMMLNSAFYEFRIHPKDYFVMTKWKEKHNQPKVRYAQITLTCTHVFKSLQRQFLIYGIGE